MKLINKYVLLISILVLSVAAGGCKKIEDRNTEPAVQTENTTAETTAETQTEETETDQTQTEKATETEKETEAETQQSAEELTELHFVDKEGEEHVTAINPAATKHSYKWEGLTDENGIKSYYENGTLRSRMGIDVSEYQGDIDWQQVRDAGIEFVFIRLGYRGYGNAGAIQLDKNYNQNIQGAKAAGLDVGVYFFSQAVNETEAIEEAQFIIQNLQGYTLELPIVFDPEEIKFDNARTDGLPGEQFTKNCIAFCDAAEASGFMSAIYTNMLWEAFVLDLELLKGYTIWYADYEPIPQTPYQFSYWQYSESGSISGIGSPVDLNLQFIID